MTRILLLGAVLAAALAGGVAWATIPDDTGLYTACKLNVTGTVRLIDPSGPTSSLLSRCTSQETRITWNQKGQKGDSGAGGPQGLKGETGAKGDKGDPGTAGELVRVLQVPVGTSQMLQDSTGTQLLFNLPGIGVINAMCVPDAAEGAAATWQYVNQSGAKRGLSVTPHIATGHRFYDEIASGAINYAGFAGSATHPPGGFQVLDHELRITSPASGAPPTTSTPFAHVLIAAWVPGGFTGPTATSCTFFARALTN